MSNEILFPHMGTAMIKFDHNYQSVFTPEKSPVHQTLPCCNLLVIFEQLYNCLELSEHLLHKLLSQKITSEITAQRV